ncbi:MAG: hypothetical protein HZB36_00745 [Candidatus Omnitrophica bacterium]|nr:hypothetical protein [Candidatus Omnitrophota bacterium]
MKIKTTGLSLLVLALLVLTVLATEKVVSARYDSQIVRLKGEAAIYQAEAENYAKTLRSIRETAATVAPIEKAQ